MYQTVNNDILHHINNSPEIDLHEQSSWNVNKSMANASTLMQESTMQKMSLKDFIINCNMVAM